MADPTLVAVKATEARFRALRHVPSGFGFDAEGKAYWPADQFTFRLRDEGALRLLDHTNEPGVPEGVIPGVTPGYPVDAVTGRLLDLDAETRARLAQAVIGGADDPAEAAPALPPAAAESAAPTPNEQE